MAKRNPRQADRTRGDATATGQHILRSLRRIMRAVDRHGRRLAQRHRLTGPQLICLREVRRQGALNPGMLARSVSLSPATVTGILDRLEARGLLTRERRSHDKRQIRVELTEAGVALLEQTPPPLQERFLERLEQLPPAEQAELANALERVVALMDAEDIDAAPLLETGAATGTDVASSGPVASPAGPSGAQPAPGREAGDGESPVPGARDTTRPDAGSAHGSA